MEQTYNILAVVVLGLILELIIAYKLRSDKKRIERMDETYKKEFEHMKHQLEKVVSATRNESQEIISKTLDQYDDVRLEVQNFSVQLHQRIDEITQEIVTEQKKILQDHAQRSSQELVQATEAEIQNLSSVLQKTIVELQQKVSDTLFTESQAAQKEIESYKKDQIEKIAKESEQLVNKVAKTYLGRVLHSSEKHELTMQLITELWQKETTQNEKQ